MKEEENKKILMKKSNIIRNIFGGFFIFGGFCGICVNDFLAGFFMMLFGISLLPIVYEKTKLSKVKYIQIILPIILIFISIINMPEVPSEDNTNTNANIAQENGNIEITNLKFNEAEIQLDIKESKYIVLEVQPVNANIENLEYCSSDNNVLTVEKTDIENNENKVTLKINPIKEGSCEIFVKTNSGIESNKVTVKIVDNERIEKEKREAEEQAKKEEEELKQKQEENRSQTIKKDGTSNSKASETQKNNDSKKTSNNSNGKTVYRTPSGKRYHYDSDCGGKNSYSTTLSEAISAGLTPCQKCAK